MRAERMRDMDAVERSGGFDVQELLRDIAQPRLTGSEGAAEVTAAIRGEFQALGYDVQERSFQFNPWPGRVGISVAGVLLLVGTVLAAIFLNANLPYHAVAILLIQLVVTGLGALFARPAIDRLSHGCVHGSNLFAMPAGGRARYIIMAHRDSKSQPVPLAFRGPAIALGLLAWLALFTGALAHTLRPLPDAVIVLLGALGGLAGLVLIFCYVTNASPGALDNASGVVAALGIAERERGAGDVAFLITDAEELGLAGARAAARDLPPVFGVINIDGLDDDGAFYVFERFGLFSKRGLAPHLAAALLQEAEAQNQPANRRDLPLGIPVDHIPIVKAGTPALTLMRGSMRSLRRVHRPADNIGNLTGAGVRSGIDLVCGALARLREQARPLER